MEMGWDGNCLDGVVGGVGKVFIYRREGATSG